MDIAFPLTPPLAIRFQDLPPAIDRLFRAEFGRMRVATSQANAPDLLVRFVDRLPEARTWEFLDPNTMLADDTLVVVEGGSRARLLMTDDGRMLAEVERTMSFDAARRRVVFAAVALLSLSRNTVVVHGSATQGPNGGVVLFGSEGAGKTSVLTGLIAAGHQYVADDQLLLTSDRRILPLESLLELRLDMLKNHPDFGRLAKSTGWRQAYVLRALLRTGRRLLARIPTRPTRHAARVILRLEGALSSHCFFLDSQKAFGESEPHVLGGPVNIYLISRGAPESVARVTREAMELWLQDKVGAAYEPLFGMMASAGRFSPRWQKLYENAVSQQRRVIAEAASLPGTYVRTAPGSVERTVQLIAELAADDLGYPQPTPDMQK